MIVFCWAAEAAETNGGGEGGAELRAGGGGAGEGLVPQTDGCSPGEDDQPREDRPHGIKSRVPLNSRLCYVSCVMSGLRVDFY